MLPLVLSGREQRILGELTDRTDLITVARRAQALLWIAAGQSIETVAERLHVCRQTVYNWITAFQGRRQEANILARLSDKKRSGRPPSPARLLHGPSPNPQERDLLEEFVNRVSLTPEAQRAQALLWIADGESAEVVAVRLHVSRQTVYNWLTAFEQRRSESDISVRLANKKRNGRPSNPASVLNGSSL